MLYNTIQFPYDILICKGYCIFDICSMCATHKCDMILFSAILVLENTRVHFLFPNYGNIMFYIKTPINKVFYIYAILWIPNVNLYYHHIRFWRSFDNPRTWSQNNIVKMWVFFITLLTMSEKIERLISLTK